MLMRTPVMRLVTAALLAVAAGCASTSGPETGSPVATPPRPTVASLETATPSTGGTLTPSVAPPPPPTAATTLSSPIALTPLGLTPVASSITTPEVALTPTPSPTLGPPTSTSTPAPDQATVSAAQSLDQALVAFAQAQAQGDTPATLQAQRQLLETARKVAATARADQSPYGQQLQSALDAVQGAAAGSYDQLNGAHKQLAHLIGSPESAAFGPPTDGSPERSDLGTPVVSDLPRPATPPQSSLPDAAQNLKRALDAYVQANNTGGPTDLLRAQRDLITATMTAEAVAKDNHSPQGQQLQRALTALHDALGGDAGKFRDAQAALAAVNGSNGTGTSAVDSAAAPAQPVDLQPLQNDLDNKLQALQTQRASGDKDAIQKAQTDLQQSIQKASDTLSDDHSPQADRFRDALGTAREAASGDGGKIQIARDQLKAALGQ